MLDVGHLGCDSRLLGLLQVVFQHLERLGLAIRDITSHHIMQFNRYDNMSMNIPLSKETKKPKAFLIREILNSVFPQW